MNILVCNKVSEAEKDLIHFIPEYVDSPESINLCNLREFSRQSNETVSVNTLMLSSEDLVDVVTMKHLINNFDYSDDLRILYFHRESNHQSNLYLTWTALELRSKGLEHLERFVNSDVYFSVSSNCNLSLKKFPRETLKSICSYDELVRTYIPVEVA